MGKKSNNKPDYVVALLTIGLALFGIVMVFSATYYYSQNAGLTGLEMLSKQSIGVMIGIAAMFLLSLVDYHIYNTKPVVYLAVIVSVGLLIAVFFTDESNGAHRWIDLGFFEFQPAEIARITLLIYSAYTLTRNVALCRSKRLLDFVLGTWQYIVIVLLMCGLIILEPSLSMTLITVAMLICVFIIAGVSLKPIIIMGLTTVSAAVVAILTQPWRLERVLIFTHPWTDSGDTGYQLTQSLYALGSGGLLGVGLGHSKQKLLYLTYGNSDFILSIIGEELGFIGVFVLLIAYIILIVRCFVIAMNSRDLFGTLLATGIASLISIQLIMNVAVVTCSMPPTGVPLPFISAGNTSLIMFMSAVGIVLNISRQYRSKY